MLTLKTLLIICPLVFLAGFVDAVAGGGGVISIPAYLLAGVPMKLAAGTNKFANGFGTALASWRYARSGNINWLCAIPAAVGSLAGSSVGTSLAVYLPEDLLQMIVVGTLPVVAVILVLSRNFGVEEKPDKGKKATLFISLGIGLLVGLYDGLVGPGTGTFLLLIFCNLAKMDVRTAGGNVKLVNLASNVGALFTSLMSGKVFIALGLIGTVTSVLGHYIGSGLAIKNGSKIVKPTVIIVLILLAIKVLQGLISG